jgi:hypothetical protein
MKLQVTVLKESGGGEEGKLKSGYSQLADPWRGGPETKPPEKRLHFKGAVRQKLM